MRNGQASDYQLKQNGKKPVAVPDGRIYPWGNIFVSEESESTETVPETSEILTAHLTAIGVRPAIVSPYGVGDVVGNVWEWTADWYQPYTDIKRLKNGGGKVWTIDTKPCAVVHGWKSATGLAKRYFRCANRLHAPPDYTAGNIGFRCVREAPPAQVESVHVPIEPLTDYVKQRKLANLHLLQKRTGKNGMKDILLAAFLIGGATYSIVAKPDLVLGAVTAGIIGVGFLCSAGVNFWRRWRAVNRAKQVASENPLLSYS